MRKNIFALLLFPIFANGISAQVETSSSSDVDLTEGMSVAESELMNDYTNKNNLSAGTTVVRDGAYNDQIIQDRLSRIPTTIDMPLNDITRKYIDTYSNRMRRSVSVMLGSSNFYNPIFEEALERYGLPYELKFLPVIESALRPSATSHAGAAGLWQFMPATGKRYGLEINTLVDERRDPVKSSEAAARYLSDLYKMFGDWGLAIAAYNCGEYTIQKALVRAGVKEGADYWSIYNYLPHETRGYVPAFIAASYIMNYYCEHGIVPMDATLPASSDTIVVSRDARFSQIASYCNVSIDELRSLNPQFRKDIVPRDYAVRLPAQALEPFITNEENIYGVRAVSVSSTDGDAPAESTNTTEATQDGGVSIRPIETTLAETTEPANYQSSSTRSVSSSRDNSRTRSQSTRQSRKRQTTKSVSVKSGDSLSRIARQNGTTVDNLRKLNGIKGSTIQPGQKIRVK